MSFNDKGLMVTDKEINDNKLCCAGKFELCRCCYYFALKRIGHKEANIPYWRFTLKKN